MFINKNIIFVVANLNAVLPILRTAQIWSIMFSAFTPTLFWGDKAQDPKHYKDFSYELFKGLFSAQDLVGSSLVWCKLFMQPPKL